MLYISDQTLTFLALFLLAYIVPITQGEEFCPSNLTCCLESDANIQYNFRVSGWVTRGDCIRRPRQDRTCYDILSPLLDHLVSTREAEYAGAASVLSLLPTIGALFGSPTSEIWRLKSIVPFGGAMAIALSFGGALMPSHVEEYEKTVTQENNAIGSIISLRRKQAGGHKDEQTIDEKLQMMSRKIKERIDRHESIRLPKHFLIFGLFVMFVLFSMAQAAMGVVEQGGIINWWCSSRWWMHLWYVAGMFFTMGTTHTLKGLTLIKLLSPHGQKIGYRGLSGRPTNCTYRVYPTTLKHLVVSPRPITLTIAQRLRMLSNSLEHSSQHL